MILYSNQKFSTQPLTCFLIHILNETQKERVSADSKNYLIRLRLYHFNSHVLKCGRKAKKLLILIPCCDHIEINPQKYVISASNSLLL